ncbi:MAG: MerR family transcriptional regulator [Desulfobacterales bacterium]|jgi:DNA-binding transcriptional MerR regulator/methylmalonyl-CoA mutase cobalamin-binding subunit
MKTRIVFPIRYAARQTGLTTHLIRVWEKRYQAVIPQRTDTNRRIYTEGDIKRLQLLKKAVEVGHNISQVANLNSEELMRLINLDSPDVADASSDIEQKSLDATYFFRLSLASVVNLDVAGLETTLDQAAVHLTKLELIDDLIVPLCREMGESWKRGDQKVITEHLAVPVIRAFLWDLLRSTQISEASPKIVISTPSGQMHELGALTIALIACESGWHPLYFGPNLPADEIAAAVAYTKALAVALSTTLQADHHRLLLELKKLRRYLSDDTAILIGGQAASGIADFLGSIGIQYATDAANFRQALDNFIKSRHD